MAEPMTDERLAELREHVRTECRTLSMSWAFELVAEVERLRAARDSLPAYDIPPGSMANPDDAREQRRRLEAEVATLRREIDSVRRDRAAVAAERDRLRATVDELERASDPGPGSIHLCCFGREVSEAGEHAPDCWNRPK